MASGGPGEKRNCREESFLSSSTAAQTHVHYFPANGTHFTPTRTCLSNLTCTSTKFDLMVLGVCIRHGSSTSTKTQSDSSDSRLSVQLMSTTHRSQISIEPTTL